MVTYFSPKSLILKQLWLDLLYGIKELLPPAVYYALEVGLVYIVKGITTNELIVMHLPMGLCYSPVIRASVPKLDLDSTFEQKNDIAKAVEEELEKVIYSIVLVTWSSFNLLS